MAEHTPGPWAHYDDRDTTQRHEIAATGKTVARIYCTNGHEEEDDANARLIAAAPELLSALEAIAQIQRDRCENARAETLLMLLDNKVGIARAAIAQLEKEAA